MQMIKRIFLFFITNIAIIVLLWIVLAIVENVFWIKLSWIWQSYLNIFIYAIIIWFTWSFISLFLSKWTAKRAYNIRLLNQYELSSISKKERLVFDIVYDLSNKHWIKLPEVWIYESSEPNAFATWATKNSSLVAVSTWLLNIMEENEIKWVVWHEMSHIFNWDMVTMVLLQWIMNTFVIFLSRVIANIVNSYFSKDEEWNGWYLIYYIVSMILEIVLWILASIIVMWFSRYREYKADEWSAKIVWKENMIAWLKALKKMIKSTSWDDSRLATMKISTKTKWWLLALFSSHPDIDDRIEALERLTI